MDLFSTLHCLPPSSLRFLSDTLSYHLMYDTHTPADPPSSSVSATSLNFPLSALSPAASSSFDAADTHQHQQPLEQLLYTPCYLERYVTDTLIDICPIAALYDAYTHYNEGTHTQCKADTQEVCVDLTRGGNEGHTLMDTDLHNEMIHRGSEASFVTIEEETYRMNTPEWNDKTTNAINYNLFHTLLLKICWNLYCIERSTDVLGILEQYPTLAKDNGEFALCKAKCLLRAGNYKEAISFISNGIDFSLLDQELSSALCLVFGECYEAVGVVSLATDNYISAIATMSDLFYSHKSAAMTVESSMLTALSRVIGKGRLSNAQEHELIMMVPWNFEMAPFMNIFLSKLFNWPRNLDAYFPKALVETELRAVRSPQEIGSYLWDVNMYEDRGLNTYRLRQFLENDYPGKYIPRNLAVSIYNARAQAESYYKHYDFQTALSICKYILDKDPFDWETLTIKCSCMLQIPACMHALVELAARMRRQHPQNACTWYVSGCGAFASRKYLKAIESFMNCYHVDSKFAESAMAAGHAHSLRGNSDNAVLSYHSVAKLQPLNYRPFLYLGMEELREAERSGDTVTRLGQLDRAEMYFTHAIELNSEDPYIHNEFGALANARGKYELAASWFRRAIHSLHKLNGSHSIFHSNLGYASLRNMNIEAAMQSFQTAIEIDCSDYDAWLGLGVTQYQTGKSSCIVSLQKAYELSPTSEGMAHRLLTLALEDRVSFVPPSVGSPFQQFVMRLPHSEDLTGMLSTLKGDWRYLEEGVMEAERLEGEKVLRDIVNKCTERRILNATTQAM